eukprot:scaffold4933_cov101-Isochrysis_galbana.AAC.1
MHHRPDPTGPLRTRPSLHSCPLAYPSRAVRQLRGGAISRCRAMCFGRGGEFGLLPRGSGWGWALAGGGVET